MVTPRRPTSFFVDARGGVRAGRLLVLAVLAALVGGVALASPDAPTDIDTCEKRSAVHATIR
jgi:hypothetical protein